MQSNGNGTEVWEKGIQVDLPDGEYEIEVEVLQYFGKWCNYSAVTVKSLNSYRMIMNCTKRRHSIV